jgi:bifunctional DNA-binding transcriptional regulator/antitoxin component of YhaV-PrlF toxin-antitoxin module
MMKAAEFTAHMTGTGTLVIPATVKHELQLRPDVEIRVIILRKEDTPEDLERLKAARAEAWRKLDEVRAQLAGKDFNATEALIESRREEDEAL